MTAFLEALTVWVFVLASLVIASAVLLVIHRLLTERKRRTRHARLCEVAGFLAEALVTGELVDDTVTQASRRWRFEEVATVLRRARVQFRGSAEARATAALESMGAVDRLLRKARSKSLWTRVRALAQLGDCGGEEARDGLLHALDDREHEARRAAREGLLLHRVPQAINAAIESYVDDAPSLVAWRRSFFSRLGAQASHQLAGLLRRQALQPQDQKLAIEVLAETRSPEALEIAIDRVGSPDPEFRASAARLFGKLREPEGNELLLTLLEDSEWYVRATAARSLSTASASVEVCQLLRRRLNDSVWWVRSNAAYALASLKRAGTAMLLQALGDDDRFARDAALSALINVDLEQDQQATLAEILKGLPENETDAAALDFLATNPAMKRY